MATDPFLMLMQDTNVYDEAFIRKQTELNKHISSESYRKNELKARHDYVCLLLTNTKAGKNVEEKLMTTKRKREEQVTYNIDDFRRIGEEKKRKRMRFDDSRFSAAENDSDDDFDYVQTMAGNDDSDDGEIADESGDDTPFYEMYRYICIETCENPIYKLNELCQRMGMDPPNKIWDIVDTEGKQLIEVKVTVDSKKYVDEFMEEYGGDNRKALVILDPVNITIETYQLKEPLPGVELATTFLVNRYAQMTTMSLHDLNYPEGENLLLKVFPPSRLTEMLELFKREVLENNPSPDNSQIFDQNSTFLMPMRVSELFRKLEKPHKFDGNPIRWKGKITPLINLELQIVESDNDKEILDEIMFIIDDGMRTKITGFDNYIKMVDQVIDRWGSYEDDKKNFSLFGNKKINHICKLAPELTKGLGINQKKTFPNGPNDNMRQLNFKDLERRKYMPWFDNVLEHLGQTHNYPHRTYFETKTKKEDSEFHKIYEKAYNELKDVLGKYNISVYLSLMQNLHSRIGSTYITRYKGKETFSKICVMPLICNMYDPLTNEPKRYTAGFVVRGPQHAKLPTDKICILIFEFIKDPNLQKELYKEVAIFKLEKCPFYLSVRKNSVKKIDNIHLAFIENSLFVPMNMIGEIADNYNLSGGLESIEQMFKRFSTRENYKTFFVARVVEMVMMAAIGNSRDEGYFAMARKLFMVLLLRRREKDCLTLDLDGFCSKMNECLIDNPYSMHFHMTFLYILSIYADREN
uniref:Polymerase PA n=1 Tax=Hubei orthomyxo-like virus 2 TaxID=1923006 RepID=A0A1L3KKJ6_9VIRU|nr:polymerase PA [Hubei orthomyxo-like virus 2]